MNKKFFKLLLFFLLVLVNMCFYSCNIFKNENGATESQKKLEKRKKQREKEELKAYKEAIKKHISIQSPDVKKRMRRSRKLSKEINSIREE